MTLRTTTTLVLFLAACGGSPPPAPPPPAPAAPAPAIVAPVDKPATRPALGASGIWLGSLSAGPQTLRIQLRVDRIAGTCALDSLDQHAFGIPCTATEPGDLLKVEVPAVHGVYEGKLSPDAQKLDGTWSQGMPMPLSFARQTVEIKPAAPTSEPAMPPVEVAQLQAVMDKDLAAALGAGGDLGPGTDGGITIGVVHRGVRRVLAYGTAKPGSVFEIGSVSKTFTGLLLAQLVAQNKVKLDEPVRALLPAGTVAAPASGPEITLVDLSAQRSGLPRLPDNMSPKDQANPYADYDRAALFAFLKARGVAMPAKPAFGYSNLGVGLLGEALALRAGVTYEALLKKQITGPLGMKDTAITLTPALKKRFIPGHDGKHAPARAWDLGALGGAGAIRSTAADMLTYLEAQLHPDKLPRAALSTPEGKALPAAIAASHAIQGAAMPGVRIALNWLVDGTTGMFFHDGATGGYSSFAMFDPTADLAVVVLWNTSISDRAFAQDVAKHVIARVTGQPAVALGPMKP